MSLMLEGGDLALNAKFDLVFSFRPRFEPRSMSHCLAEQNDASVVSLCTVAEATYL